MNLFSKPRHYSLAEAADGTLSVEKQGTEVITAITNSLFGALNGGKTGSTGWSNTLVAGGLFIGGAMTQDFLASGQIRVPLINAR